MIAVIIPARNEADVIGKSVASLLQQNGVDALRIFVVDDNSTDGTAEAARAAADHSSQGDRVSVMNGRALPAGWSGKLWAVQQGIEQAALLHPEFFLLTDADIEHSPENVATLVRIAEAGDYDLASYMVKLHCRSAGGKAPDSSLRIFLLSAVSARSGFATRGARPPARRAAAC